jgi:hypothetical protein
MARPGRRRPGSTGVRVRASCATARRRCRRNPLGDPARPAGELLDLFRRHGRPVSRRLAGGGSGADDAALQDGDRHRFDGQGGAGRGRRVPGPPAGRGDARQQDMRSGGKEEALARGGPHRAIGGERCADRRREHEPPPRMCGWMEPPPPHVAPAPHAAVEPAATDTRRSPKRWSGCHGTRRSPKPLPEMQPTVTHSTIATTCRRKWDRRGGHPGLPRPRALARHGRTGSLLLAVARPVQEPEARSRPRPRCHPCRRRRPGTPAACSAGVMDDAGDARRAGCGRTGAAERPRRESGDALARPNLHLRC